MCGGGNKYRYVVLSKNSGILITGGYVFYDHIYSFVSFIRFRNKNINYCVYFFVVNIS